ncbi:MmgE/PrpD family protein [Conexibacter sp. CPCC 206217]|uniref:MmgE/PrpD family protein n=1 Tax=Conexibacter sp. CPCC 206217 TaxID=3064574 RepID=UPI00271C1CEC|nr:MmgE/PrpD family protein [Conexibacter sp. CPCC 206217]MDO8211708.1 MmgE/PrpD family protein [Conexibacter sp. CPCC 206217]
MTATAALTDYFAGLSYDDLPPVVTRHCKRLLLDTLACALGGSRSPLGDVSTRFAAIAAGEASEASIAGSPRRSTAVAAASANGRMAGALDADDTFTGVGQTSHHGAGTVVAALALAERGRASGGQLLAAIAAGAELGARFDVAVPPRVIAAAGEHAGGWRVGGGPAGVLSAAVAAANVLGLDAHATMHAVGIAGAHVDMPPLKWFEAPEAPMVKSMDGGWNAATGVSAGLLAQLGMTGHVDVLDGDTGLWRAMGYDSFDFAHLAGDLGERWSLLDARFKRWPCQYWMQPSLGAFDQIVREQRLQAGEIESVQLRVTTRSSAPRFRETQPRGFVTCQFNFPHVAAMLALGRTPGPLWFDAVAQSDPEVAAFRERVEVEVDPGSAVLAGADPDDRVIRGLPGAATVRARGRTFTQEAIARDPHDPDAGLSDDELVQKLRDMTAPLRDSDPAWEARTVALIGLVGELETVADVRALGRLLRPDAQ